MERLIQDVLSAMVTYETGSPKRIQHFIKVYTFSKLIGLREGLDPQTQLILETTAAVHDIGIRKSLEVYGSYTGKTQEELGPAEADALLTLYRLSPGNHRPGMLDRGPPPYLYRYSGPGLSDPGGGGFPGQPLREGRGRGGPARRL